MILPDASANEHERGERHCLTPLVTVLMPAFNCELHVADAVRSILAQTFGDFEFLIIDDGSTDSTWRVLQEFVDPRIRLLKNVANIGLISTLNRGLSLSKGRFIARMDADDISAPERLQRQVDFLVEHPEVHVVGTMVDLIDDSGRRFGALASYPKSPEEIHRFLLQECCLIHPSVMYRRDTVLAAGGYSTEARHAEDYELWLRLADHYQIANLPDRLLSYRMHPNQVSIRNLPTQHAVAQACRVAAIERRRGLGEDTSDIEEIVNASALGRSTAAYCTLGRDYLNWSRIYRWMGDRENTLQLASYAVRASPLSFEAWSLLCAAFCGHCIPPSVHRRLRWYLHKLKARIQ